MNRHLFYVVGLAYGITPSFATAHTRLIAHHHNESDYWLSMVPEIVLAGLSLVAIAMVLSHIKRAKKRVRH